MNCEHYQEKIEEHLAVGVPPDLLPERLARHLGSCEVCQDFVEESLLLSRLLEEPLPLPPAELAEKVLAAVNSPLQAEAGLGLGERLAWASLGGMVAVALQGTSWAAVTAASESFLVELSAWFASFKLPSVPEFDFSATVPLALTLAFIQGVSLWMVRRKEMHLEL